MEPITIVTSYVAMKMVDQFISQEGYGFFKKLFFSKKKYADILCQLIEESSFDFEKRYPLNEGEVPFYHSKPLFDALNDYVLFQELPSREVLTSKFEGYPNITPPTQEQLESFYLILTAKINSCIELKKLHIEETYKDKVFEIGDTLFNLKLMIESLDNKLTFSLDSNWLDQKCSEAVADLDTRYTPELNFKLNIVEIFEGIGRTDKFSKLAFEYFDNFLTKGNKLPTCEEITEQLSVISQNIKVIKELFQQSDFTGLGGELEITQFKKLVSGCEYAILDAESELWKLKETSKDNQKGKNSDNKFIRVHRDLREFEYECTKLNKFLDSTIVNLSNNPYLLLEGEAGIGKSHLLADIINTRVASGYGSVFILGQLLTSNESPWSQIFKRLQLNITSNDFLEKLNLYGQHSGKRVLIFVDAINEGDGNKFWRDYINSFVDEIRQYKWLGLVLSVRTTYKHITISAEQIARNNFETHKHTGFKNVEFDAVSIFYDYHNIERPSSPNLNPEFKNPLFLKLFCEGIKKHGLSKVPTGFHGITKILGFFVEGINKSLASDNKYNFDPSFPLVSDAINSLIQVKIATGEKYILLKDAFLAVNSVVKDFVTGKNFLRDLIDEGMLTKGLIPNDDESTEEVVYISFERFDDHLTVNYLLDKVVDIEGEFEPGGRIRKYFKDEFSLYSNQGIVEALSIQLPEKYNKELYELLPEYSDNNQLIMAFLDSLVWRNIDSIDFDKLKPFINENVCKDHNTYSHFLEILMSLSALENHPFNADSLHGWLLNHPLADRDEMWTINLKYKYSEESTFRHLINWAWSESDKTYISNKSIELAATAICWLLTSSNRELRDCSTKALVRLLEDRIPVLTRIIKNFDGVDDVYIWERIFAVALGCTLRTKNHADLKELAEVVYSTVFCGKEIYPHILLRDYAREIIEYVSHLGVAIENVDLNKIKPPYNSSWPEKTPTKTELKELYDNGEYIDLWSSVMGGGDFSRYTIGTNHNHSDWSGCKFGEAPVNRMKIFADFKKVLSEEQSDLLKLIDPIIYEEGAEDFVVGETVIYMATGRKTEKEISINKLAFKRSLSDKLLALYESEVEPYLDHNNNLLDTDKHFDLRLAERFIFNRVIELGWAPEKHGDFDRRIGTGRGRRESHQERIGKKYQWIAYYEFMARLVDNFVRYDGYGDERQESPYMGAWEPYVRDIDPTILLKTTKAKTLNTEDEWWVAKELFEWDCSFEDWIKDTSTLSNPHGFIEVKDTNGDGWLVLESYPGWKEPKIIGNDDWGYPRKEMRCHLRSYLVKSSEYEVFKDWFENNDYTGRGMPEVVDRYQLFNREFYWSEASEFFKSDYYEGSDWIKITDRETNSEIADVSITSINYLWEEEFDRSKIDTLSFLKPSSMIFKIMDLTYGIEEGSYVDKSDNVVCFSPEAIHDTKSHLLVKKEPFLKMLKENELEVVWKLSGEKGVIGGSITSSHQYGRVEFSGAFYIDNDNDEVKGEHKILKTRW